MAIKYKYTLTEQRIIGVLLLIISIWLVNYSFEIYSGQVQYPEECHGRGFFICSFTNMVYENQGYFGVALIHLAISMMILVCSYVLLIGSKSIPEKTSNSEYQKQNEPATSEKLQTIEDIVVKGEEPTEEFLEDFAALRNAPPVSDEELEKQALAQSNSELAKK